MTEQIKVTYTPGSPVVFEFHPPITGAQFLDLPQPPNTLREGFSITPELTRISRARVEAVGYSAVKLGHPAAHRTLLEKHLNPKQSPTV